MDEETGEEGREEETKVKLGSGQQKTLYYAKFVWGGDIHFCV